MIFGDPAAADQHKTVFFHYNHLFSSLYLALSSLSYSKKCKNESKKASAGFFHDPTGRQGQIKSRLRECPRTVPPGRQLSYHHLKRRAKTGFACLKNPPLSPENGGFLN
jgi:hypothetical protein